ncbi:MAG: hypothetical protein RID53_25125 [Coleofasciculus sp. B1-GNL1-01]|uniref:hypothetical protein n=1 Tax=Coleofasciculus sp. B1-GNL1-01 TaxID=3068484 RepID=UPI0032F35FEA
MNTYFPRKAQKQTINHLFPLHRFGYLGWCYVNDARLSRSSSFIPILTVLTKGILNLGYGFSPED